MVNLIISSRRCSVRKLSKLLVGLVLALVLAPAVSHARIISTDTAKTQKTDAWCVYGRLASRDSSNVISNGEVCVDVYGDLGPTTAGGANLGNPTTPWADMRISSINANGRNTYLGGSQRINNFRTLVKQQIGTVSGAFGFYSSSSIVPTSTYIMLLTSGVTVGNGQFLVTATPTISTTVVLGGTAAFLDGTEIILGSTDNVKIRLQDDARLAGTNLKTFAGSDVVVSSNSWSHFVFSTTDSKWHQVGGMSGILLP